MAIFLILALAMVAAFTVAPFVLYALYRLDGGKRSVKQFYRGVF